MADQSTVHIGENSPEQIAYKLMKHIAGVENVNIHHTEKEGYSKVADRAWILQTYGECLWSVRNPRRPA